MSTEKNASATVVEAVDPDGNEPTVVLGEEYRSLISRYERAVDRFQRAQAEMLDPNGSVRKAISYVTGLSHGELPKEAEAAFLELLEQASKLNAMTDSESRRADARTLCCERVQSIASLLEQYSEAG